MRGYEGDANVNQYLSAPSLSGTMRESPLYQAMGNGLTDRVFLLGHSDGLELNDPYRVMSVQEAVNVLQANVASPLLRGLIETYYSGCRDIHIVAVAPMSEYVGDVIHRNDVHNDATPGALEGTTFYQRYHDRLQTTLNMLLEWDLPQVIVPLEASFLNAGSVDFLTQLTVHCANAFASTGVLRIGFLGCRGTLDDAAVEALVADERLTTQGSAGKFVAIIAGEGLINVSELPTIYATSPVASIAGELSSMRLDRGLCYHRLQNVIGTTHPDLRKGQIERLAQAKVNPLIRLPVGRRGASFQTALATDNTLGQDGSDYWSLLQVRLISKALDRLRAIGRSSIGTASLADVKGAVNDYFLRLVSENTIRGFSAYVRKDDFDRGKVLIDVSVKPFFGLREIRFGATIGPGI